MTYLDRTVPESSVEIAFTRHAAEFAPRADRWDETATGPRAKTLRMREHEIVFEEGDAADRLYEIADGAVMLYKMLPDGRRQVLEILGQGDLFGLSGGDAHDCTAETLSASGFRVVDRRDAEASVAGQQKISLCLRDRLTFLHEHAVLLGRKSACERVATFLLWMALGRARRAGGAPATNTAVIRLAMTRQEIADHLGLTIETVSRVISDIRRRGIVVADGQDRLRVPDVRLLARMSSVH